MKKKIVAILATIAAVFGFGFAANTAMAVDYGPTGAGKVSGNTAVFTFKNLDNSKTYIVSTRSRRQSRHRCGACGHAADPGHRCPGIHGNDRLESDENHAAVPETTDGRLTFSYARSRGACRVGLGMQCRYNRVHD